MPSAVPKQAGNVRRQPYSAAIITIMTTPKPGVMMLAKLVIKKRRKSELIASSFTTGHIGDRSLISQWMGLTEGGFVNRECILEGHRDGVLFEGMCASRAADFRHGW